MQIIKYNPHLDAGQKWWIHDEDEKPRASMSLELLLRLYPEAKLDQHSWYCYVETINGLVEHRLHKPKLAEVPSDG